ncbi:YciE/YciF ferroxidase family protein [Paucihalobacter sp.]|uniref:YciE/YciF ferroxidase family protein n=1 Tax=Paucihalobacter sp. TaxID=2850405 RepID=UPI002FE0D90B
MKDQKSGSTTASQNGKQSKDKSKNVSMESSQLMELFEDQLKDIYWAEKALTKAIPKMIKNASSSKLEKALTEHLEETKEQIERLEKVFKSIDIKPAAKKCDAMEGLIKEAEGIMEECEEGPMSDAGIILAAQKVEHYEIASYGTLRQFAEKLGLNEVEKLLEKTLKEEKAADQKLSKLAEHKINVKATKEKA